MSLINSELNPGRHVVEALLELIHRRRCSEDRRQVSPRGRSPGRSGWHPPISAALTLFHVVGISREAAVAWIVSDSKLVSFTSRHLGTGPTQHDTFVRARCNRAVSAGYRPTSTSVSLPPPPFQSRGGARARKEDGDNRHQGLMCRPRLRGTPGLAGSHPRSHGNLSSSFR